MRIVAGTLRGKSIVAPEGEGTRPTIDRVREALFSSLYSLRGGFEGAMVLDAFAGSGALGIEALSRGAGRAIFYERSAQAAKVLKANLDSCGIGQDRSLIVQRDVLSCPPTSQKPPFDLIFLDPPYAFDASEVLAMPCTLASAGALSPDAVIVYEHAIASRQRIEQAALSSPFDVHACKKYGKTGIVILKGRQ